MKGPVLTSTNIRRADGADDTDDQGVRTILVPASLEMVNLLGPRDEFLRLLEGRLDADVMVRGNRITLTGPADAVELAWRVLTEMITIIRTCLLYTSDAADD